MSELSSEEISAKHLIDSFSEGILVLNSSFHIVFASNVFLTLGNYSLPDIIGRPVDILFPEKAGGLKFILQNAERKPSDKLYTDILSGNKRLIPVRISLTKDSSQGHEQQYYVFIKDGSNYHRIRKDILKKAVVIERLSKSRKIRDGKLAEAIYEILQMASRAINTERVNVWLMNEDRSEIECIGNYDASVNAMVQQESLSRITMPRYFNLFEKEMIITTSDAINDPVARELLETYLKPNRIHSLMDIPVRIEGEIIGVLCFEHRDTSRVWNLQEQKFALVMAQMISLALETSSKQKARNELTVALNEQKVLLKEVHHRVKNNLAIIASLLNLQTNKAKDEFHKCLLRESRNRIDSIATIHDLLYQSKSFVSVNFNIYMEEVLSNLQATFSSPARKVKIVKNINPVTLQVSRAIPLALIVNELVTNSFKHAFTAAKEGIITVSLSKKDNDGLLVVRDNGPGYDPENVNYSSVGMDIINALVSQIDGGLEYSYDEGAVHVISFSLC